MKEATARGLKNAVSLLLQSGEFDRVRMFLVAEASSQKSEADEIIRTVCDDIRTHLLQHSKAVSALKRGL